MALSSGQRNYDRPSVQFLLRIAWLVCLLVAPTLSARPGAASGHVGKDKRAAPKESSQQNAASRCHRWVAEEVPFITTAEEQSWAANVKTDKDCDQFIKDFWERRNPNPGSPQNKFKEQYYRRVAYATEHFHYPGSAPRDDRARIYVGYGPPDRIETPASSGGNPTTGASPTKERWTYKFIDGIGDNVTVEFIDPSNSGEYRVVTDPESLRRPTG